MKFLKCTKDFSVFYVANEGTEWQFLVVVRKYCSNYDQLHSIGRCKWNSRKRTVNNFMIHFRCIIDWHLYIMMATLYFCCIVFSREHFKCCKYLHLTMNLHLLTYLRRLLCDVEVEWCSIGDVGDSADADVHDAVCQRLWKWWRPPSIHQVWQVQQCWAPSVYHAGISMLVLASYPEGLARVTNQEVVTTPDQAAAWAWAYMYILINVK